MSDVQEPLTWGKSAATAAVLEQLTADRLLPINHGSERPVWIPSRPEETEPNPPEGYCNTRFIKRHKPSNHIRARIKSHVYTTE